jgi:hypothetical protein
MDCRVRLDGKVARSWTRRLRHLWCSGEMVTVYGVVALSFMMTMYALEGRGRRFVLAFAVGCALSSSYGFLSGAWPFGVVEAVWTAIALRRFSLQAA